MIKILCNVYEAGELRFRAGETYEECDATRIQLAVGNGELVADAVPEAAPVAPEPVAVETEAAEVSEPESAPETPEKRRGRPRKNGD